VRYLVGCLGSLLPQFVYEVRDDGTEVSEDIFQYRSLSFVALHIGCDRIQDLLYGLSLGRKWNTPYYCGAREVG